jgi:hypothetical protein
MTATAAPAVLPGDKAGKGKRSSHRVDCQVPGCTRDVSLQKAYSRRYRVCEIHLVAHTVEIDGRQQRFCQQCSRFQDVGDFDANKR